MPFDPHPTMRKSGAYLLAFVMMVIGFWWWGVIHGFYMLATCVVVWYAARNNARP